MSKSARKANSSFTSHSVYFSRVQVPRYQNNYRHEPQSIPSSSCLKIRSSLPEACTSFRRFKGLILVKNSALSRQWLSAHCALYGASFQSVERSGKGDMFQMLELASVTTPRRVREKLRSAFPRRGLCSSQQFERGLVVVPVWRRFSFVAPSTVTLVRNRYSIRTPGQLGRDAAMWYGDAHSRIGTLGSTSASS